MAAFNPLDPLAGFSMGGLQPISESQMTGRNPNRWAEALAILGATLQDVGAGIGGRPANALQNYQQRQDQTKLQDRQDLAQASLSSAFIDANRAGTQPNINSLLPALSQLDPRLALSLFSQNQITPYQQATIDAGKADRAEQTRQFNVGQAGLDRRFDVGEAGQNARSSAAIQAETARAIASMANTNANAQANRDNAVRVANIRSNASSGGPEGPFAGMSIEAQDTNILLGGDPGTQEYAAAFARQAAERALPDGTRIKPDMRPYRPPTYGAYADQGARAPGSASVTPAGVRQGKQMAITMGDMVGNLKGVINELKPADRAAFLTTGVVTPAMAKAQAAFNLFISQLRDPSILNTGVLQAGELAWINQMFPGPGSFSSLLQGNTPLVEALDEVNVLMRARRRSFDALDENAPQGGAQPATQVEEWERDPVTKKLRRKVSQ